MLTDKSWKYKRAALNVRASLVGEMLFQKQVFLVLWFIVCVITTDGAVVVRSNPNKLPSTK